MDKCLIEFTKTFQNLQFFHQNRQLTNEKHAKTLSKKEKLAIFAKENKTHMNDKVIKIVNEARWADGQNVRTRLDDITYNPMRSQEEFVMRLTRENARTEYGRRYDFTHIHSIEEFRKYLPLTTYEDYIPYIESITNGKKNILTAYLTEHISVLDDSRKLPQSRWSVQTGYDYSFCAGFYLAGHYGYLTEGMTLNLMESHIEHLSSGVTIGNLLGRLLTKRKFDSTQVYVIPVDTKDQPNEHDKCYTQALYALSQRDISLAMCDHYDNLVELLRYIEKHWPKLTEDIEQGHFNIPSDPERANAIREKMEYHHIGTQMVEDLWPGLRCIMVRDVDNLSASFELLRTYCGSKVHFIFTGISSPEGTFSTAINLDDPQTVLIPDSVFYEFKPKEASSYYQLLTLDQLEIGRSYELVVTTLSGLYRYQTKKTILVVGRYHDTPTVIIDKE